MTDTSIKTASDIPTHTRVKCKTTQRRGVVIGNTLLDGDQMVAIQWEDTGDLAKMSIGDIQVCLSLEEEFEQLREQVNSRLRQAADLIREANQISKEGGSGPVKKDTVYECEEELFDVGCIESAMSSAGWSTSSWYC